MGVICGPVANATYDAAYKFVQAVHNMLLCISRAFFPFLARNRDKHHLYAFIVLTSLPLGSACYCPPADYYFLRDIMLESVWNLNHF